MTTKELLRSMETDVRKLELREKLESDPIKKAAIRKRKESCQSKLAQYRSAFDRRFITEEGEQKVYETATVKK